MSLRNFFRGAMLGTAIGDAIGRSRESRGISSQDEIEQLAKEKELLRYTDDTQQMVSLAEMLAEKGGFDGKFFGERLVENFNPARRYGPGSTKVIRAIERGQKWSEPASSLYGGEGSYGNGSSMRTAPVGLFYHDQLDGLKSLATDCSRITHIHRLGIEGSVLQSYSVALAVNRKSSSEIDTSAFLEDIRWYIDEEEYLEKLDKIGELLDGNPKKEEVINKLGNGFEALHSVPTALYSFLSESNSFEDSVTYAVSLGGDADTIGAMTGAISGAYFGFEAIPSSWLEKLEDKKYIIDLADSLLESREKN